MQAGTRYRHTKRGSTYTALGVGKMQAEDWFIQDVDGSSFEADGASVAVYRSEDDGSLWVRPLQEFKDGRFVEEPAVAPVHTEERKPVGYLSPSEAERALGGLRPGKVAVITGPETAEPRVAVYLQQMPLAASSKATVEDADALTCFVCSVPFQADDICATDINDGTAHAACLEGSPVVDLNTGDPTEDPVSTWRYGDRA